MLKLLKKQDRLQIYPYWNVNNIENHSVFFLWLLQIYPYWNVNINGTQSGMSMLILQIYPYWNVNVKFFITITKCRHTSNLSILECKWIIIFQCNFRVNPSNLSILECKSLTVGASTSERVTSNLSILECKYRKLIFITRKNSGFKSIHTGM